MKRKHKTAGLAAAAFFLAACACAEPAMAYFTTGVTAAGGYELQLGFTTTVPEEEVYDWTKYLKIQNTGEEDCYIRVKAFAGEQYPLTWADSTGGKWSLGQDDYWYYHEILKPGGTAEGISVKIEKGDAEDAFQVIVVQECTPVLFGTDGAPLGWEQTDWSGKADVVTREDREDV